MLKIVAETGNAM